MANARPSNWAAGRAGPRTLLLLLALLQSGCGAIRVPAVNYRLPAGAHLPLASSGIQDRRAEFAATFCGVLRELDPGGAKWGDCGDWVEDAAAPAPTLPPLNPNYRILLISEILSQCAEPHVQMYSDAQKRLDAERISVHYESVPALGSSEFNAEIIARYLASQYPQDARKFIVVGYSKGAPDVQVMLANYPLARDAVAALITVAGSVGGSRLPDSLPSETQSWIRQLKLKNCQTGDGKAFESLRREVRQQFLEKNPRPLKPTYSLAAVSKKARTSRILLPSWRLLLAYAQEQDSQMILYEAIAPGAAFLGVARGDHWAVAMPFEVWNFRPAQRLVNHNHYPRVALLEAAVRLVMQDLPHIPGPCIRIPYCSSR